MSIGAKDFERKSNGKWNVIGVYDEKNAFADGIMAKWLRGSSANEIFLMSKPCVWSTRMPARSYRMIEARSASNFKHEHFG